MAPQDGTESADMVEKEAKRLEVLKRRQERELNQLVQYELMRKALQVLQSSMHALFRAFWSGPSDFQSQTGLTPSPGPSKGPHCRAFSL